MGMKIYFIGNIQVINCFGKYLKLENIEIKIIFYVIVD